MHFDIDKRFMCLQRIAPRDRIYRCKRREGELAMHATRQFPFPPLPPSMSADVEDAAASTSVRSRCNTTARNSHRRPREKNSIRRSIKYSRESCLRKMESSTASTVYLAFRLKDMRIRCRVPISARKRRREKILRYSVYTCILVCMYYITYFPMVEYHADIQKVRYLNLIIFFFNDLFIIYLVSNFVKAICIMHNNLQNIKLSLNCKYRISNAYARK